MEAHGKSCRKADSCYCSLRKSHYRQPNGPVFESHSRNAFCSSYLPLILLFFNSSHEIKTKMGNSAARWPTGSAFTLVSPYNIK